VRFRIKDAEKAVLESLEMDFLSPEALDRAADLAMEYINKLQSAEVATPSAQSAALADIDARENIAQSREALRTVLAEGRLVLRPDVANARFEDSLVLSHEEFSSKSK